MNNAITPQTIQDYLKGRLTGPEQARVQEYLATHMEDPEVQKLLDRTRPSHRLAGCSCRGPSHGPPLHLPRRLQHPP